MKTAAAVAIIAALAIYLSPVHLKPSAQYMALGLVVGVPFVAWLVFSRIAAKNRRQRGRRRQQPTSYSYPPWQ